MIIWNEMSYNKYNYKNKNRFIEEEYNEELDSLFEEKYGIDMGIEYEDQI